MNGSTDSKIQVVGHAWAIDLLKRQDQRGRIAQSLLLTGSPNIGKSTVARFFAQFLNCQADHRPCGICQSCRKLVSGNHPDIRVLDADEPLKIAQVRDLQREMALSPVEGQHRVAILCNFERATTSAANALLKTLEEPAPQVVIILTATEPGNLLPTIVSRCQILRLRPLSHSEVLESLQSRWQVESEKAELLTQLSAGRLGWAVNALTDEEFLERRNQYLNDLLDLLRMHRTERLGYANEMSRDAANLKEVLTLWLTVWRDLLLLKSGSQTPIINLDWQAPLEQIAPRSSVFQAKEMVVRLQRAYRNLERNVNPRLNLEIIVLKLPRFGDI